MPKEYMWIKNMRARPGDLLVAEILVEEFEEVDPPAGWTLRHRNSYSAIYEKICSASEPANTRFDIQPRGYRHPQRGSFNTDRRQWQQGYQDMAERWEKSKGEPQEEVKEFHSAAAATVLAKNIMEAMKPNRQMNTDINMESYPNGKVEVNVSLAVPEE